MSDSNDKRHVVNGDAHTLPSAKQLAMRRANVHKMTKHKLPDPLQLQDDMTTAMRAQLDTGADMTCSNIVETLNDCREQSESFPCEVHLVGAIGKDGDKDLGVHPWGGGHLHTCQQLLQLDVFKSDACTHRI